MVLCVSASLRFKNPYKTWRLGVLAVSSVSVGLSGRFVRQEILGYLGVYVLCAVIFGNGDSVVAVSNEVLVSHLLEFHRRQSNVVQISPVYPCPPFASIIGEWVEVAVKLAGAAHAALQTNLPQAAVNLTGESMSMPGVGQGDERIGPAQNNIDDPLQYCPP